MLFAGIVTALISGAGTLPVAGQGIAPPGGASPEPGIAPGATSGPAASTSGPDLDTTIDYIEKNTPAQLTQTWVQAYDEAGDRQQVKFTVSFIFTRAAKCSLTVTRRNVLDAVDTSLDVAQPPSWYFPSGLHLEEALTDYNETRQPVVHNQIDGASHTGQAVETTAVLHLDRLYVGDLKLYPVVPGKLPLKAPLAFSNSEQAVRVLRAIDHAAALCGASDDPFAH